MYAVYLLPDFTIFAVFCTSRMASSVKKTTNPAHHLEVMLGGSLMSIDNLFSVLMIGHAFINKLPYIELKEPYLQSLASSGTQLQFYQTAIFMGCNVGEIELGMSTDTQINLETEMRNYFPEDFSRQQQPRELPQPTDQDRPSSSSSSLLSLSLDSTEYSPLFFSIPSSSYIPEPPKEAPTEQAVRPLSTTTLPLHQSQVEQTLGLVSTTSSPLHEAIQSLSQIRATQFPSIEIEDAAMTKAILAVLSSSTSPSPSSSSSSHQPQQNLPPNYQINQKGTAFKSYRSALAPTIPATARIRRQNMLKRAMTFFRNLNLMRRQGQTQGTRPTSTQLHHMISERKRREKLNESFQTLRSLLPPGSKKDKASVLASTTEYLGSLKAQVAELSQRNQILEAAVLPRREVTGETSGSLAERLGVQITNVAESTSSSETRMVDLQVTARGESSMVDLVIRILEFLKGVKNVSLISVEANTQMVESSPVNRVVLRLKIECGEWDESAFQEAVRRVVDDLAQ
ncbi:unnamed protein product [Ilex paraguariensis]|uniref:BHLH domain-containing protein n=1 Tax=Ilex paraguariensis TaxID=185542 RepID=A0ABC8RNA2_9AQUA